MTYSSEINLLEETLAILTKNGKGPDDIEWCGAIGYGYFSWADFERLANVDYDNGFGAAHVVMDLLIVGKDFWLERHEYDGAEGWEYKSTPVKPENYRPGVIVSDNLMWDKLKRS